MAENYALKITNMFTEPLVRGNVEAIEKLNLNDAAEEYNRSVSNVFIKLENGNFIFLNGHIDNISIVTAKAVQDNLTSQTEQQTTQVSKLQLAQDKFK